MIIKIRNATVEDMCTVAEINIACVPNGTRATWGKALTADFFRFFLEEDKLFLVAEVEDKIVGYVMGYFKGSNARSNFEIKYMQSNTNTVKNKKTAVSENIEDNYSAVLYSLCVLPDYSRHGIGKKLAKQFSENVALMGGKNFCLSTGIENQAAQRVYERIGMNKICDTNGLKWYTKGV